MKTNNNTFYFLLFLAMIGWGASWVNAKILSLYINEYEMIFFRFSITAITMVPIIVYMKKSFRIDRQSFILVLASSFIFLAYMKYYFLGTKLGTASLGGAFVTTLAPIITFILLALLGEKKITIKESMALVLGAVGVLIMLGIWHTSPKEILVVHNLYFILAAILWPILTIMSAKSTKISPLVFTFYLYIITVAIDMIFFVDAFSIDTSGFDRTFWLNILLLSMVSTTFSNTIYFLGIEKLGASNVSSFIFLVPFSAIGLSILFLGEKVDVSMILGTILTIYAVKILNHIKFFKRKI